MYFLLTVLTYLPVITASYVHPEVKTTDIQMYRQHVYIMKYILAY